MIEFIGIAAGILILISLVFRSTTEKTELLMRIINSIGAILFIIYGFLLPAYSTAIINGCILIVNIYNISVLLKRINEMKFNFLDI